jgi:RNA polymerase sigma factor (sigma-70 family)
MTVTVPAGLQPTTSTTELLRAASAGDQAAWRELLRRFEPLVMATIVAHRLQFADAHDAAQGTWLRMIEHHREIREPEALAGWLRTTATRECLRIIRDRQRHVPLGAEGEGFRDAAVNVEQSIVDADTADRMRSLADVLPPRAAMLVTELFRDDPPGYAELARRTGVPIGSIGPTRGRALRTLRRLFEEGAEPSRMVVHRA